MKKMIPVFLLLFVLLFGSTSYAGIISGGTVGSEVWVEQTATEYEWSEPYIWNVLGTSLQRSGPVHQLAKKEFEGILKNDIVYFNTAEGKNIHLSLEQFIDYYNALPVQQYLVNTGSVLTYLYKISYATYIRKDAERLGITNDPKFRLDKKNYMNSLVYQKYEEQFLKDTAFISSLEIEQTYDRLKSRQQALDEVRDLVIQEIRQQRLDANRKEKYKQLSKRYRLKGTINNCASLLNK